MDQFASFAGVPTSSAASAAASASFQSVAPASSQAAHMNKVITDWRPTAGDKAYFDLVFNGADSGKAATETGQKDLLAGADVASVLSKSGLNKQVLKEVNSSAPRGGRGFARALCARTNLGLLDILNNALLCPPLPCLFGHF